MNRTLSQMLKTLTETQKSNWKESLNKLVDVLFGLYTESGSNDQRDYVEKWKQGMEEAYTIANENAQKAAERSKRYYDSKVKSSVLQPGERVLVQNPTRRGGPGKLCDFWEDMVHTVVRQMGPDLPIYAVRPER